MPLSPGSLLSIQRRHWLRPALHVLAGSWLPTPSSTLDIAVHFGCSRIRALTLSSAPSPGTATPQASGSHPHTFVLRWSCAVSGKLFYMICHGVCSNKSFCHMAACRRPSSWPHSGTTVPGGVPEVGWPQTREAARSELGKEKPMGSGCQLSPGARKHFPQTCLWTDLHGLLGTSAREPR